MSRPVDPPAARMLSAVGALLCALGCMCGAPAETVTPDPADLDGAVETTVPVEPTLAAPAAAPAAAGGWTPTIEGICQMEADCGCLEKESVAACAASLQKSAVVFSDDVNTCIVTQSCASMCAGGAVRCVDEGTARKMAAEQARHEAVMGVMQNFPNGGPCANGQTQVVDSRGGFVRCQ